MRHHGRLSCFAAWCVAAMTLGCWAEIACSLVACESGLQINFATSPSGAVHVEALASGSTASQVFDCANASLCQKGAFFRDFTARTATITITASGRTGQSNVNLTYVSTQPNGPDCGPACAIATASLPLP